MNPITLGLPKAIRFKHVLFKFTSICQNPSHMVLLQLRSQHMYVTKVILAILQSTYNIMICTMQYIFISICLKPYRMIIFLAIVDASLLQEKHTEFSINFQTQIGLCAVSRSVVLTLVTFGSISKTWSGGTNKIALYTLVQLSSLRCPYQRSVYIAYKCGYFICHIYMSFIANNDICMVFYVHLCVYKNIQKLIMCIPVLFFFGVYSLPWNYFEL
eukprot:TRINITY_DN5767_c0_g1_i16.p2 TRINITY_DN5767_c0_g1~~TRINITY_DN5767_c0_g1_i16.p2  ORF type:complete len:215 (-),score=-20.60 TRINITY_DN5767_c0_g1_i16:895-1539(-)